MSALLVGGASTFVSCKDYDGDQAAELNAQVGSLKEIVEQQTKLLEQLRDNLDPNKDAALYKSVDSFLKGLDLEISSDAQKLNEINAFAIKLKTLVDYDWSNLKGLEGLATNSDFQSMVASAGKINSLIQQVETEGWGEKFQNLVTLEQLNTAISEALKGITPGGGGCSCDLSVFLKSDELLEKAVAAGLIKKSEVEDMLKGYYTKEEIDALLREKVTATDISDAIAALRTEIETKLGDKLDAVTFEEFKTAYTENFDAIVERIDNLETSVGDLVTNVGDLESSVGDLESSVGDLESSVGDLETSVGGLGTSLDLLAARVAALEELAGQMTTLNGIITNLSTSVGQNTSDIAANSALIAANSALIAANTASVNGLTTRMDALENRLDNFVTGINVDKVSNPIFGSLNLPFGVKSTVMCGIYGSNLNGVTFPVAGEGGDYVFEGQENWTLASDAKPVTFDGIAQQTVGGNIYLSIQPNNVEAAGKAVTLISRDRQNYAPGYSLALLANDNSKITTRSAAGGTYVAQAVITNPSAAKVNIDKQELADAAKKVWNSVKDRSLTDIPSVAKTIYSTFKNAIPEYYAVDYAWMDGNQEKHVWSDYEIAAVTIKPLSFETLKDKGYTFKKSIPQLEEYLGISIDDIRNDFVWTPIEVDSDMETEITITLPDPDSFEIEGTVPTPEASVTTGDAYVDENGDVVWTNKPTVTIGKIDISAIDVKYDTKEKTYQATVTILELQRIVNQINDQVSGMMGNVTDILDKVENGFDKINNSVIARLNNVIAKVNKITENPNNLLQPVMIYRDAANGTGRLSESPVAPTRLNLGGASNGSIAMYPTSYTAELLAPAYKKYVQVTPLDGGTASFSKRMLDAGHESTILTATAGKYEIVYSAIDFYGKIVAKKYYIEVK